MTGKIIALIDGSAYGESVCDHAAWVAQAMGTDIELLHVLGRRDTGIAPANLSGALGLGAKTHLLGELAAHDRERAHLAKERGRAILDAAGALLNERGVSATTRLRNGDLLEAIERVEGEAELIVVGKRGEAADFAGGHLGSNLERVVRSAHKPVLVASRSFRPVERALIAFDGGASATKAVRLIAEGKLLKGVPLHIVTAGTEEAKRREALKAAAGTLRAAEHDVTSAIIPGEAEAVIADYVAAHAISLLVMGAYGHSRIRNLIIGSTTTAMIRECAIPVMLLR